MTLTQEQGEAWATKRRERLDEIERVLKFDVRHPDRRQLVREYIELTEPEARNG